MTDKQELHRLYEKALAEERAKRLRLVAEIDWYVERVQQLEGLLRRARERRLWQIGDLLTRARRRWWRWVRLPIDLLGVARKGKEAQNHGSPSSMRPPNRVDLVAVALNPELSVQDRWRLVRPAVASRRLGRFLRHNETDSDAWSRRTRLPGFLAPELSELGSDLDEQARRLLHGQFRPSPAFEWIEMSLPPDWGHAPIEGRAWDFYLHSLQWLHPLLERAFADDDDQATRLVISVIDSWISSNSVPPGSSQGAWFDHAVALRLRLFSRFWDGYRRSALLDEKFAALFLSSVYQHALYACDPNNYNEKSNHGLEIVLGLTATAVSFPEFREASRWLEIVHERLEEYETIAFSREGLNKEQSPSYHFFILQRLAHLMEFLRLNEKEVPSAVSRILERGVSSGLHILRSDGSLPRFGDSTGVLNQNWRHDLEEFAGLAQSQSAPSASENPRGDNASLFVSFDAGYAVFRGARPEDSVSGDVHLSFKCNYFEFPHYHRDGGSIILYALGREWIVDAGVYGTDWERPERQYVRSARAHNVVLVDDRDFEDWPMELISVDRGSMGDTVAVRHHLDSGIHDRSVTFQPPDLIVIADRVEQTSGNDAKFHQLLHIAPDLDVRQTGPSSVDIGGESGHCEIRYFGDGSLSVESGVEKPQLRGWHSPRRGELVPTPVLTWEHSGVAAEWRVEIRINSTP